MRIFTIKAVIEVSDDPSQAAVKLTQFIAARDALTAAGAVMTIKDRKKPIPRNISLAERQRRSEAAKMMRDRAKQIRLIRSA